MNTNLKNLFKLSSRVTIYVPSTTDIDKSIDTTEYVNKTHELLSTCFGGSTETKAVGCWMSPTAGLVKETTTMVFSYCKEEDLENNIEKVYKWCYKMCDELKQDSIALELNGVMYFVETK